MAGHPVDLAVTEWSDWSTGVRVAVTDAASLGDAEQIVRHLMQEVDAAASRFRADSELSCLVAAAGQSVGVSELLWELVAVALRAARLTDGLVDPTVGPALVGLGYDRTIAAVTSGAARTDRVRVHSPVGWNAVRCDPRRRTVLLPEGCALDLGATAKAWTADRAAASVADAFGCGVLVSLGGDVAVAGPAPAGGWIVGIAEDHRVAAAGCPRVAVSGGGLATSSITTRVWRHGGRQLHHIIDPATGLPSRGPWRTVTVAAASCTDANTASTAAIVRGAGAAAWLEERGLSARLVDRVGSVVTVAGWPEDVT